MFFSLSSKDINKCCQSKVQKDECSKSAKRKMPIGEKKDECSKSAKKARAYKLPHTKRCKMMLERQAHNAITA